MTSKLNKLKCFLGIHSMQPVEYLDESYKRKSSLIRYSRKCNCCGYEDIYVSKFSQWEGHERYVETVKYLGEYPWYKFVEKVYSKLSRK